MIRYLPFLFAVAAFAQPVTTPIRDTVYDQFGNLYNGTATIQLSVPGASTSAARVLSLVTRKTINSGLLSLNLVPNDAIIVGNHSAPGGSSYVFTLGNGARYVCAFPTSATALPLKKPYCDTAAPSLYLILNPNALSGSNLCVNILSNQLSLSTGCGGPITALSWLGLT